jgi:hypothetical protein
MVISRDRLTYLYQRRDIEQTNLDRFIVSQDTEMIKNHIGLMLDVDDQIFGEERSRRMRQIFLAPPEIEDEDELKRINLSIEERRLCMLDILAEMREKIP